MVSHEKSSTHQAPQIARRYAAGPELSETGGVHFRVWAPARRRVQLVIEHGSELELDPEQDGYFSGFSPNARAGDRYRFRLDGERELYPDPASRFQPEGPHGPSEIVDPRSFPWADQSWPGLSAKGQIVYELHLGTFTREGTWNAAARELPELASIGITAIEVMPVAEFGGGRGWGYDGVNLYAPSHLYGSPDDARAFINEAHRLGLGVILDVVYNHFGPDGNYIGKFSRDYFTDRFENDWGEAINFEPGPVRDYYADNAAYWIGDFHFDGLRLDATQDINDRGPAHILKVLTARARQAAGRRSIYVVAENEPQDTVLVREPAENGYGLNALWNDDFHHSALVALTGRREAYYTDYRGAAQEFVSAVKHGYLYQGQFYKWQKKRRGTPALDLPAWNFVNYIENHDQVANSGRGLRARSLAHPGDYRAMSALLLLAPQTPMLFQGQEFGATTPFLFFAGHQNELRGSIQNGRREFLSQFRSLAGPEAQATFDDPCDIDTFRRSMLDFREREKNKEIYSLYKDLMKLRREDPVFRLQDRTALDGAVFNDDAFLLRYFGGKDGDRLVIVNLGHDLCLNPAPEPLLAPPWCSQWTVYWSSEDTKYGGTGIYAPETEADNWIVPAHSALVLKPDPSAGEAGEA